MAPFLTAARQMAEDFACVILDDPLSGIPFMLDPLSRVPGGGRPDGYSGRSAHAAARARTCRIGRNPNNPTPTNVPAQPGAQTCAGSTYTVSYIMDNYGNLGTNNPPVSSGVITSPPVIGPIGPAILRYTAPNTFTGQCRGFQYEWALSTGGENLRLNMGGSPSRDGNPACPAQYRPRNIVYNLVSGPNNCNTTNPPYDPITNPPRGRGDLIYDPPGGGAVIVVPVGIVLLRPTLELNGQVNIPVRLELPDFNLNVDINLSTGDVNFNFGGGSGGSPCCPAPDEPVPPPPVDPEDPPPPGNERRIVGILLRSQVDATSPLTQIGDGTTPTLYVPRLAAVRFAVKTPAGRTAWTEDIDVKTTSQYIPVNYPGVAYDYSVIEYAGVTSVATPVYL